MSSLSDRLREVRESLGLSQQALADKGSVTGRSQRNYEAGERFPDAAYLMAIAAAGADVRYILTGARDGPAPERLSDDERAMLADYREASGAVRRAARAALQSGTAQPGMSFSHITQTANAPGSPQVIGSGNTVQSRTRK